MQEILDAYLAGFTRTPLVMAIGGGEMLRYAVHSNALPLHCS